MTTAKDILTRLTEQNHNVPEEAYRAICLFDNYIRPIILPIFTAKIQRRNHRLDRAEIYIDVTIGYISLSDFKIESLTNQGTIQNIATGYYTSWIKIEDNYIVRKEVVNPTFVQRSEYYGKIV